MHNNKILFVTIPEKGHINPMIGIAQHLQDAGFELAVFAQQDISPQLQQAGLQATVYFDTAANDKEGFVTKGKDFAEKITDQAWLRNWIKTLLIDAVPGQLDTLRGVVKAFNPSVIVTDPMVYAAAIVAKEQGIPWAGISSSLNPVTPDHWHCALTGTLTQYNELRSELFRAHGLQPVFKVSDAISPWLNIVFTTETYVPRGLAANYSSFYVGHSLPQGKRGDETDFPFHLLRKEARKVYMSLGSQVYYHPHLFKAVSEALPDEDIQLVFSVNELYNTPFVQQLPENVLAVKYTPQLQLLPLVDLFITHGGANSVMEALANGVPLAMLPVCNDQFLQAQFLQHSGAGIVLDTQHADAATYRQQLLPLLHPHAPARIKAAAVQYSFMQHDGAQEAAGLIKQLYQHQQPMLPIA